MKDINEIDTNTEEGKMLMAALAKITTESQMVNSNKTIDGFNIRLVA